MDKLKEAVVKLITTNPNTPLPPTQMAILQDRLIHVFSQFRTPNHPPYAAMIQRALQELNQKGGSSEESISQFIEREYDDLPWAHSTMLTHHLSLLCKSGELLATDGLRYLVAGSNSGPASMKCRRKRRKKRRRWNFEQKQSKRRKTESGKLQIEDQIGVTEEIRKIDDQQNQVPGNRTNDRENCEIEGIQQLNQEGAVSVDMLRLSVGTENAISRELSILTIEPPRLTRDEFCAEVEVRQEEFEPRNAKMIEVCDPLAELQVEREPNQDDMLELLSTEMPPGFEFMSFEKSSNNCHECSTPGHHSENIPNLPVSATTELCGSPSSSEHHHLPQGHVLQPVMTSTAVSINKQQIEPGEHRASSNLDDSSEICGEESRMPLESTSETGFASHIENHRQVHNRDVVEPSNTENIEIVDTDVVEPSNAADSLEIVDTCPLRRKKNLQIQSLNHSVEELKQSVAVLALPHQQKEHQLLETERIKGKQPLLEASLKSQQINKQYYRKKRLRCQREGTITKDATVEIDQTAPKNVLVLSNIEESQMPKPTLVELSSEREDSCVRQKGLELLAGPRKASSKTQKDPKRLNQDFESVQSDLERVSIESLGVHDSSETKRMQRQLRRWSAKRPDPKPTVEFMPSSELSENYKLVEMLSSDEEEPQEQKQMSSGLTQIREQRAKLRSWQKQNAAQPQQKNLTSNHSFVEISPEPEPRDDLQPRLQQKLLEQGKSSQRALRPRPPRPEAINSVNLDMLKPSDVHCTKQQTDSERQGQSLKAKPDATGNELVILDLPSEGQQQSVNRGRGRPPSSKFDATTVKLLTSNSQFEGLQHSGERGRGRPPKKKYDTKLSRNSACSIHQTEQDSNQPRRYELDKAADTDGLLTLQHQHENQQQKKHRRQGGPPQAKLGVIVVSESTPEYQDQQEQKQAKRQGRRVPPGKDSYETPMDEEGLSPSNAMPNTQEQPKDQHRGRPPKLETGKKNLRSSKTKPRK